MSAGNVSDPDNAFGLSVIFVYIKFIKRFILGFLACHVCLGCISCASYIYIVHIYLLGLYYIEN